MNKIFIIAIVISALTHIAVLSILIYYNRPSDVPFGDGIVVVEIVGDSSPPLMPARQSFGGGGDRGEGEISSPIHQRERIKERESTFTPIPTFPPWPPEGRHQGGRSNKSDNNPSASSTSGYGTGTGTASGLGTGSLQGNPVLSKIRSKIERSKYYPPEAKRQKLEGRSVVAFQINPNGTLANASLKESSGVQILDDAALETLRRATPLPYYESTISIAIKFALK